jgi:hypothetical protein
MMFRSTSEPFSICRSLRIASSIAASGTPGLMADKDPSSTPGKNGSR